MRPLALLLWLAFATGAWPGEVTVRPEMLRPDGGDAFRVTGLDVPDLSDLPVIDPARDDGPARLLRHLLATTSANGHRGVLYDNRDRGHSALPESTFPGLAHLRYSPELAGGDFGLAIRLRFPAVVLGNSSTALTRGPDARSLMRLAMTEPGLPRLVFALAANNHLYVYPEHRDHDGVDLYPANWAYMVTSQGSSGSDRPFLDAFAMTLAAFPREVMAVMKEKGLVVPTLQMILRRNLRGIDREESYYSGTAHPTVFDAGRLRPERMVAQAASLTPDTLPPMVRLGVITEDFTAEAGLSGRSERLFTTPSAIARIWRDLEGRKRMNVSATATRPRGDGPVAFRWVLLRGDPERVSIIPDETGAAAEIIIDWHDAFEVPSPNGPITASRVDIGVFADTGGPPSAPAIISISFPTHQSRSYRVVADGAPILRRVDYDAIGRGASFDPVLHWSAPWADEPVRDANGAITGWRRTSETGVRVVPAGPDASAHEVRANAGGYPVLAETPP